MPATVGLDNGVWQGMWAVLVHDEAGRPIGYVLVEPQAHLTPAAAASGSIARKDRSASTRMSSGVFSEATICRKVGIANAARVLNWPSFQIAIKRTL